MQFKKYISAIVLLKIQIKHPVRLKVVFSMIFQQYNIKVIKIKSYNLQLFCIRKVIERKITEQGKLA